MTTRSLTAKQRAFLAEYLANGRSGAKAYRAVYGGRGSPKTMGDEAARLLQHPAMAPELHKAEQMAEQAKKETLQRYAIDQAGVIQRLAILADSRMTDLFRWKDGQMTLIDSDQLTDEQIYAISEIRQGPNGVSVKSVDKRAALMDLAKMQGWVVDRGQMLGKDGQPIDPGGMVMLIDMGCGKGPQSVAEIAADKGDDL